MKKNKRSSGYLVKWLSGQVVRWSRIFLVTWSLGHLSTCLYATTPHTIIVDGNLSDWHEDELIYDDSQNDSIWGIQNELHKLYLTWDNSALYIGVSGVQKDGNNLIVYIDTNPATGITDASLLKEGNNYWWWRRGNKFPQNFRPDFQWHMYQMKLNPAEGHGFFRLNDNYTITNLNDQVEQKSSGGGTGNFGSAEIKIPWSVIYGGDSFPSGEKLQIVATLTGGMDTKGTDDPSDDHFGSARDTIPDQQSKFPSDPWYAPFTVDSWLSINFSDVSDISPIPRKLEAVAVGSDSIKLSWQLRGVVEKNLTGFNIYYSTDSLNFRSVTIPPAKKHTLTGLIPNSTYHFYLRALYNNIEMGKSETIKLYLNRPVFIHTPLSVFPFPGRKIGIKLTTTSPDISKVKLFYKFGDGNFKSEEKNMAGDSVEFNLTVPLVDCQLKYYFIIEQINGRIHYFPEMQDFFITNITQESSVTLSNGVNDFGGGLKLEVPDGAIRQRMNVTSRMLSIFDVSSDDNLHPVAVYEFYALDNKNNKIGVLFDKPVTLTLRYFDEDVSGMDENKLAIYRIVGNQIIRLGGTVLPSENTVTVSVSHLSKYGIFYEASPPEVAAELKRVVRPVFNPSLNEVIEFQTDSDISYEIFDLNHIKIFASDKNFWHGRDNNNNIVSPGIYIYKLQIGNKKIYGSCVVVR